MAGLGGVVQDVFSQPLRTAGVGRTAFQNSFHQRKFGRAVGQARARDDVANHVHIWMQSHLVGLKAFNQFNAEGSQLVAHRRVDAGIATGDFVARFPRQRSQSTHERAANSQNMYVHVDILGGVLPADLQVCLKGLTIKRVMHTVQEEIAATAARMVVEEGLEYGPAKRRAVKQLGLNARAQLPSNDQVEDAVRDYLDLFCADTQPMELRALRELAIIWMERMADFRPHLGGAVWRGTATGLSDVYLQLFCDDPKSAEISLIDHNVRYEVSTVQGFQGEAVDALSVLCTSPKLTQRTLVHLMIYDADDVRGALKPDDQGRTQRGDLRALLKRMKEVE